VQSENVVDLRAALSHRAAPAPREIPAEDWRRYESYVEEIFTALGMEPDTPGTRETPQRFLQALYDATAGYEGDPKLLTAFPAEGRGGPERLLSQVVEGPISFHCLCEHHALPFFGEAHVAYVARDEIIGISKLTRLVQLYARRFTVQERLGEQIADALVDLIDPHGVAVHLEAAHLCTQMRGVREENSRTVTTFWRGSYTEDAALRQDFVSLVRA
jgi:GTP cyclohydrolase IA